MHIRTPSLTVIKRPTLIRGVYHRGTRPPQVFLDVRMDDGSCTTVTLEDELFRYPGVDSAFTDRTILASAMVVDGPLTVWHQIDVGSDKFGYFLNVVH